MLLRHWTILELSKNIFITKHMMIFISYDELIDAVMFRLIQLIENIKKLSNNFKEQNSEIPWGKIIGFRNGIVHEYGKTDFTIVYETITSDLDQLIKVFEAAL